MANPRPGERPLDGLLRKASPEGDLLAQHALGELQARLFGKPRATIQIGRYAVRQRIGAGGSGVVHRAYDPKHDREVALKLLHAQEGKRYEAARDRLLREAQSLGKLDHPNIVRVYDVGTYDPALLEPAAGEERARAEGVYLAMELLEGGDLAQWLGERPRGWQEIREVFLAAGRGLAAAHARGIIHRDFKPANVSIDAQGRVRVLDFGLARPTVKDISDPSQGLTAGAQQRLEELARPLDATLTAPGTLLGTPAYMAPEQHDLLRATALSDQYSLCLALYEAWYGHRPFLAENEQELRRLKREGKVLPPPDDSEVPRCYFDALVRGLSPRPEDRFESMQALLDALQSPPPRVSGTRRWTLVVAAVGVLAITAGGLAWWGEGSREPECGVAWADAWDHTGREALRASAATAGEYAARAAATIETELDGRAREARRIEAKRCGSTPMPTAIAACLDGRSRRLTQLVEALPGSEGATLARVAQWLPSLPSLEACRDEGEGPSAMVRERLEDARQLEALGELERAREQAELAHVDASPQGDPRWLARAAALHGHLAFAAGARGEAERALTEALWSDRTDDPEEPALAAAIDLLELARISEPRPADTPLWIRFAREHAAVPEVTTPTRMRLYLGLGRLALAEGDTHRARTDLEQALALPGAEREPGLVLQARRALAQALERAGELEPAEALRARALAEALAALGPGHPLLAEPTE
ncbi:MAG: serine/threonine protein kinase [Myxococcales bacterium]|nr:serine/threonine protein kinase [Myxococcales bacterium]